MRFFFIATILLIFSVIAHTQDLPYKQEVLAKMILANNYFINKWPDPTKAIVTDKTRPSNLWTRGTYYEGLMQLYYTNRDTNLYKYAVDWGTFHNWEPTYGGTTATDADFYCCMQTYLELYQLDPSKTERINKVKANADNLISSNRSNYWWWIDALQMAMPVFARLGAIYNDDKYYNALYRFYSFPRYNSKKTGLFNTVDKMWWRDSTFLPPKTTTNGKQVYWSRGEGWVLVAMSRVLDIMPVNAPHYDEYLAMFKDMAPSILAVQRSDGFWNPSLDDPNDYGGKETSGTAMFTYAFAWGIRTGILDSATYYPAVHRAWIAMVNDALHSNGFLGYVQGTGKQPSDGQPLSYTKVPNFEDYALGAFLLAGSEVYKLAKDSMSITKTISLLHENLSDIKAYPNPTSGKVTLSFNIRQSGFLKITMFDAFGKEIYVGLNKTKMASGKHQETIGLIGIDKKLLPNGIYIINVYDGLSNRQVKVKMER